METNLEQSIRRDTGRIEKICQYIDDLSDEARRTFEKRTGLSISITDDELECSARNAFEILCRAKDPLEVLQTFALPALGIILRRIFFEILMANIGDRLTSSGNGSARANDRHRKQRHNSKTETRKDTGWPLKME